MLFLLPILSDPQFKKYFCITEIWNLENVKLNTRWKGELKWTNDAPSLPNWHEEKLPVHQVCLILYLTFYLILYLILALPDCMFLSYGDHILIISFCTFLPYRNHILIVSFSKLFCDFSILQGWYPDCQFLYVSPIQGLYPDCQFSLLPGIISWLPILWGWRCCRFFSWPPSTSSSTSPSGYFSSSSSLDVPFQESGAKNQKTTHRQKRDRQIASLLIILVLVFGSCNVVRVSQSLNQDGKFCSWNTCQYDQNVIETMKTICENLILSLGFFYCTWFLWWVRMCVGWAVLYLQSNLFMTWS